MHLYGEEKRWCKHGIICSVAQPKMFIKVVREMIGKSKLNDLKKVKAVRPGQTATRFRPFSFLKGRVLRSQAQCFLWGIFSSGCTVTRA